MSYNQHYVAIDVETGGLPSRLKKRAVHEVALTEIAAVVVDNDTLQIIDQGSWLIKPYDPDLIYQQEAADVSGIDEKFCHENGMDIRDAHKAFVAFIRKHVKAKKKGYLVGHNIIDFDLEFIENFFDYCGSNMFDLFKTDVKDTMIYSRDRWPTERKHNLGVVCERLGLPYVAAHRALPDTIMTAKAHIEFMKLLRSQGAAQSETKQSETKDDKPTRRAKFEL